MNRKNATLFIVATPIGNLADITLRAIDVLKEVDLILAEDTRRASILLRHFDIRAPVRSFHRHNEAARLPSLLLRLGGGDRMALISDAGTPLISDPGYRLVRRAREQGITVTPVPGASAVIAALSASGQPAARFCFEGFLPATAEARRRRLHTLQDEMRTLVFYEAGHRISATLEAMASVFGARRPATVAREISKQFETFYGGTLAEVAAAIAAGDHHRKGEFVIIVSGAAARRPESRRVEEIMALLSAEMPLKRASRIASQILGGNRNECYEAGVKARRKERDAR